MSVYSQRNALAREQGFRSYYYKRQALSELRNDKVVNKALERQTKELGNARTTETRNLAKLRQEALSTPTTNHELGGLRYQLYVEELEYMTREEWEERYG